MSSCKRCNGSNSSVSRQDGATKRGNNRLMGSYHPSIMRALFQMDQFTSGLLFHSIVDETTYSVVGKI